MIDEFINHTWVTVLEKFRGSTGIMLRELEGYLPPDAMTWCKADATERLVVEWNASGPTLRMMKASPESNRIVRAAVGSLVPFYVYEPTILEETLRGALRFAGGYVRKPRQTLAEQVFRGASQVPGILFAIRLSAAVEYRYLPNLLLRSFSGRDEIQLEHFLASIAAIDEAVIQQHNPDEFARLTTPIVRWSALAGGNAHAVPVNALLDFLADKRLHVLHDYVASIARIRSRTEMDFQEIASLVRDLEVSEAAVSMTVPPPVSVERTEHIDMIVPFEPLHPSMPQDSEEEQKLSDPSPSPPSEKFSPPQMMESVALPLTDPEPQDQHLILPSTSQDSVGEQRLSDPSSNLPSEESSPTQMVESIAVPLTDPESQDQQPILPSIAQDSDEEQKLSDVRYPLPSEESSPPQMTESVVRPPTEPESPDQQFTYPSVPQKIETLTFSPELRASLSASLFHGNVPYFDATVTELSRMENWREAARYLTDLLEINRLNPYAMDVMQFTDTIRKWFVKDDEELPT